MYILFTFLLKSSPFWALPSTYLIYILYSAYESHVLLIFQSLLFRRIFRLNNLFLRLNTAIHSTLKYSKTSSQLITFRYIYFSNGAALVLFALARDRRVLPNLMAICGVIPNGQPLLPITETTQEGGHIHALSITWTQAQPCGS